MRKYEPALRPGDIDVSPGSTRRAAATRPSSGTTSAGAVALDRDLRATGRCTSTPRPAATRGGPSPRRSCGPVAGSSGVRGGAAARRRPRGLPARRLRRPRGRPADTVRRAGDADRALRRAPSRSPSRPSSRRAPTAPCRGRRGSSRSRRWQATASTSISTTRAMLRGRWASSWARNAGRCGPGSCARSASTAPPDYGGPAAPTGSSTSARCGTSRTALDDRVDVQPDVVEDRRVAERSDDAAARARRACGWPWRHTAAVYGSGSATVVGFGSSHARASLNPAASRRRSVSSGRGEATARAVPARRR